LDIRTNSSTRVGILLPTSRLHTWPFYISRYCVSPPVSSIRLPPVLSICTWPSSTTHEWEGRIVNGPAGCLSRLVEAMATGTVGAEGRHPVLFAHAHLILRNLSSGSPTQEGRSPSMCIGCTAMPVLPSGELLNSHSCPRNDRHLLPIPRVLLPFIFSIVTHHLFYGTPTYQYMPSDTGIDPDLSS
jgi:hypothetical protein